MLAILIKVIDFFKCQLTADGQTSGDVLVCIDHILPVYNRCDQRSRKRDAQNGL